MGQGYSFALLDYWADCGYLQEAKESIALVVAAEGDQELKQLSSSLHLALSQLI